MLLFLQQDQGAVLRLSLAARKRSSRKPGPQARIAYVRRSVSTGLFNENSLHLFSAAIGAERTCLLTPCFLGFVVVFRDPSVFLRTVRENVHPTGRSPAPPAHSHRGKAVQVQSLREDLHGHVHLAQTRVGTLPLGCPCGRQTAVVAFNY